MSVWIVGQGSDEVSWDEGSSVHSFLATDEFASLADCE